MSQLCDVKYLYKKRFYKLIYKVSLNSIISIFNSEVIYSINNLAESIFHMHHLSLYIRCSNTSHSSLSTHSINPFKISIFFWS